MPPPESTGQSSELRGRERQSRREPMAGRTPSEPGAPVNDRRTTGFSYDGNQLVFDDDYLVFDDYPFDEALGEVEGFGDYELGLLELEHADELLGQWPADPLATGPITEIDGEGAGIDQPLQEIDEEQENEESEGAESPTADSEPEPEVAEVQAIEPEPPAGEPRRGGGGAAGPDATVAQWRAKVGQRTSSIPEPTMGAAADGPSRVREAGNTANNSRRRRQASIPEEAAGNIDAPPRPREPLPAPPASDPVPAQTRLIRQASGKRLPNAFLPTLVRSPVRPLPDDRSVGGNMPQLGQSPVPSNLFQLMITPQAEELAEIPDDERNAERQQLELAREALNQEIEPQHVFGDGESAPLVDAGPTEPPPLDEAMSTPVAEVVTRLLADMESATANVLDRLRRLAYARGVLFEKFPNIGESLSGQIRPRMNTELRLIADAAGIAGDQLDRMVADRKAQLAQQTDELQTNIASEGETTAEGVSETGQESLNVIEGARQATDEQIIERQEEASGGNDPAVINARRDLIIRWIRNHVTTQTTDYQKAGETRDRELTQGEQQRTAAYNALAQREEYRIYNPRPPRAAPDRSNSELERQLQDVAANIRSWTGEQVSALQGSIRESKRSASEATRTNRSAIETAGTDGINAARRWAEDRILEGQSWWERFKATISRWFSDSQEANEQWSVRRTVETRDGIATDLTNITNLQTAVQQGATEQSLLQQEGLTQEQQDIIREFFAQPEGSHPLDIAAAALRQRLARQYLATAKPVFEQELIAKPYGEHKKLNDIARAVRPFDGAQIAQDIHAQLDNFDTDEAAILRRLAGMTALEGAIVRKVYRARYGIDLDRDMYRALDPDEMEQARLRLEGQQAAADATALYDAMGVISTDEDAIMELLRGRSQAEIDAIRAAYRDRFGEELDAALEGDLDEGNEQDQASALLSGDTATADAIALDDAMRGGLFGWGTSEEDIDSTYARVRDEVHQRAQREGWNSAQMEAEIRRRTQAIEARFDDRYKNVEEYNAPGLEGETVLSRAISSEMDPGPERDLANALRQNDLASADAARIEIERRSVYASDDAINNVLTNQYERSLQATRLDQGPAREMRVARLRQELMGRTPRLTENQISIQVMALERRMNDEMGDEAQRRSNLSMEALTAAYDDNYTFPLWYTIETNMSGTDREKARDLMAQGGRLTDLQEVEYATRGAGTDEAALRNRIGGMTRSEIADLRRDWEARHPGRNFDDMLRGELSGRDESDIMDMVAHGAPTSLSERIDQERRRTRRELEDLTGELGGVAAGNEERWLRSQMDELEELQPLIHRTDLSDEQRAQLRDDIDFQVERVQQAVQDHRRALDSVTSTATQIAGLVVAVTVGAALTFLSGGALGPVMIAVIASAASTLTTMGTKALIQGGAYGGEDIGIDVAIGVVDALTAAATAGMGGNILRGASGAAQQAANPTRLTQLVGRAGRSGIAQRLGRTRVGAAIGRGAARANQAQSGFLVSGIRGRNPIAVMGRPENSRAMRIMAEGLAEGIENAVSAAPSAFTQTALDDRTWEGNPFLNLLEGTAMGVGMGVAMGGAMQGARGVAGRVRADIRLSTPEGRLAEANRMFGDAYQRHRADNPDSTFQQFLAHPDGQRVVADVQTRGLLEPEGPRPSESDVDSGGSRPTDVPEPTLPPRAIDAPAKTGPDAEVPSSLLRTDDTPTTRERANQAGRSLDGDAATRAGETPPDVDGGARSEPPRTEPDMPDRPSGSRPFESKGGPRQSATDARSQALRAELPTRMTDSVDVRVNADLDGNAVRVIPDAAGGPQRGIRVEAGPDARPIDVMMHAHTVQGMQRYRGLLGRLRALRDWFNLTTPGRAGWEAKLEVEKLPAIIHERMQRLARGDIDPQQQARLVDEINDLSRQLDDYQRILESPELRDGEGRGYVAAEPRKLSEVRKDRPSRQREEMPGLERTIVDDSPLEPNYGTVYRLGHEWQEKGRVYRRVMVLDAEGNIHRVREEILMPPKTDSSEHYWQQRGSWSSGGKRTGDTSEGVGVSQGAVGELASQKVIQGTIDEGQNIVNVHPDHLRNASDNGFDGLFFRFDEDGNAIATIVEAKNQPSGLSVRDFSAISGERLRQNLIDIHARIKASPPEAFGFRSEAQKAAALRALRGKARNIEIQIHTAHGTTIGDRSSARSSLLRKLEEGAAAAPGFKTAGIRVEHVPISESVTAAARTELMVQYMVGEPSERLRSLGGAKDAEGSFEERAAQSALMAEGAFTDGLLSPKGDGLFVDAEQRPFEVLLPATGGASPTTDSVVESVLTSLNEPSPAGSKGQKTVILDLDGLPHHRRQDILNQLAKCNDIVDLEDRLLIHDRDEGEMAFFDPDNPT